MTAKCEGEYKTPHGDARTYWAGCHGPACTAANAAYVAARRRVQREAGLPFPYYSPWTLELPARRPAVKAYKDFAGIRKAVTGICRERGDVVPEQMVLKVWDSEKLAWATAYTVAEGTKAEDLPWRR